MKNKKDSFFSITPNSFTLAKGFKPAKGFKLAGFFGLLMCAGMPSHAALTNNSPSLTSTEQALEQAVESTDIKEKEGFVISYRKEVLLEHDPHEIEKKTQFASVNNNREAVNQYLEDQENGVSSQNQAQSDSYNYERALTTSTLNDHLIKAAGEVEVLDKHVDEANYTAELYSRKYQQQYNRIARAQNSLHERWQRTQRLKKSAGHLADLERGRVEVINELKLKPHMKLRHYKTDRLLAKKQKDSAHNLDEASWVASMMPHLKRRMPNAAQRKHMLQQIYREAKKHQLEVDMVLAVIQVESNFKPKAVSVVGAQGLMQVMPFWKKEIGSLSDDLHDIETNIRYGTYILKHYLNREKGKIIPALARYNGSYGRMKYPNKVIHTWLNHWQHL